MFAPPGSGDPGLGALEYPLLRASTHPVILVCERRAEERHDAVAHHLVDGALVVVDGLHHQLEDGVQDLARLLGVAVGEQLHRALEIGEEHSDLLALAFKCSLGRQDFLGQVLGRVAVGRPRRRARSGGNGMSTRMAELGGSREGRPAVRAGPDQRGRALFAETRPLWVVVLASGHFIAYSPRAGRGSGLATIARGQGGGQIRGRRLAG
jgi:hypothetical protein